MFFCIHISILSSTIQLGVDLGPLKACNTNRNFIYWIGSFNRRTYKSRDTAVGT